MAGLALGSSQPWFQCRLSPNSSRYFRDRDTVPTLRVRSQYPLTAMCSAVLMPVRPDVAMEGVEFTTLSRQKAKGPKHAAESDRSDDDDIAARHQMRSEEVAPHS